MDSSHPRSRSITREPSRQIRSKRGQRPSRERNCCIHNIRFGGHGSVTSCCPHAPVTGISFRVSHLRSTLHLLEWLDADPFWRVYLDVAWRGCNALAHSCRNLPISLIDPLAKISPCLRITTFASCIRIGYVGRTMGMYVSTRPGDQ